MLEFLEERHLLGRQSFAGYFHLNQNNNVRLRQYYQVGEPTALFVRIGYGVTTLAQVVTDFGVIGVNPFSAPYLPHALLR
jgi:hypothetical protein